MSKRESNLNVEGHFGKQFRCNINQDNNMENKITLPIALIMKIFGHFDHINYLHKCMELSKEIRDNIFQTPEIMKKVKVSFISLTDWETKADFLRTKGSFLRNLSIYFEHNKNYSNCQAFNDGMQYIKSLESLACMINNAAIPKTVTNFLIQLEDLKELKLLTCIDCSLQHDISTDVKFKLKFLEFSESFELTENLKKFLHGQAESIKTLRILGNENEEILNFSFEFFVNLKKLIMNPLKSIIYRSSDNQYSSESVEHFDDLSGDSPNLKCLYEKFPNLKSIKCNEFHNLAGTFENLDTLDTYYLCYGTLKDLKLPNLKTLKIKFHRIINIYLQEPINEKLWNDFIQIVPNVEHFVIEEVYQELDLVYIVKSLRNLKNLRIFEGHLLEMKSVNIWNMLDIKNHKLLIDKTRKTMELDTFLRNKCAVLIILLIIDHRGYKKFQNHPTCYGLQTFGNFEIIVPKKVSSSERSRKDW